MLQHGAYTLLIDSCYDRERFPTAEEAIEWTWASSKEEIEAVEFVLRKFFVLEDGLYIQSRIQEEIEQYHANSAINKRIADERETKRKENSTNRARTVNEPPPNQEPLTNNHKPPNQEPNIKEERRRATRLHQNIPIDDLFEGIDPKIVADFKILRKEKRAAITETSMNGIKREALKAGLSFEEALKLCCENGWAGFKAAWLENLRRGNNHESRNEKLQRVTDRLTGRSNNSTIIDGDAIEMGTENKFSLSGPIRQAI